MQTPVLTPELLTRMNAYWRAANYLSVGQIYLYDNPLLKRPLKQSDVKRLVVGHWGTTPGQNFIYVHLNRAVACVVGDGEAETGPLATALQSNKFHGEDMPEIRHWQWPGNVKNAKTIKPRAELETAHDG
jgi:phosphoketolase